MKKRNLVIRVSEEMYKSLEKIATRKGMTLSEIARYALQRFIDENDIIIRDFRMYNVNERVLLRRKVEDQSE